MEKISNDRLLVEEFKRDFIIIIIIIIIIIKNNININTQQFNKKKDVRNKRERILTSRAMRRSKLSEWFSKMIIISRILGKLECLSCKWPINWPRSSRRIALDKLLLLKVARLCFLVDSYRQYSSKMSGGPKALRTAHRIGLENNR